LTGTISGCSLALDFDATSKDYAQSGGGGGSNSGPFCAQHMAPPAVFCDDFDSTSLSAKWPGVPMSNGSATDDSAAFVSSPSSMLSVADAVPQGGQVRAVSTLSFPMYANSTKPFGLRTSFQMRVDQFDPTNGAKNIAFEYLFGSDSDFNQIVMNLVSSGTSVAIQVAENAQVMGSSTSNYQLYGPFTIKPMDGQWIKVEVDVDLLMPSGSGNNLRVRLNDESQLDTPLMFPLKGGTPRLELGIGWVDSGTKPTQVWKVRYDNFLVEALNL